MNKSEFLTLYYSEVHSQQARANEAFGHAQAVALLSQRTSVILNSGAVGIIATSIGANVYGINDLKFVGFFFLVGLFFAVASCFASYFNLSKHSEYYELKATEGALRANKTVSNEIEKKSLDMDMMQTLHKLDKKGREIDISFRLSLACLSASYVFFLVACYFTSQTNL